MSSIAHRAAEITTKSRALARPASQYALGAALTGVILVGSGWAVTAGHSTRIFEVIAAAALIALAVLQRGAFIGVLVLAAMDGIPFLDTSRLAASHIAFQDVAALGLFGAAVVWILAAGRSARPTRLARALSWCGLALLLWCAFIAARTWANGGAPLLGAVRFGRDFFYFGLLLAVLPRVQLRRRDLEVLVAVLAAGVCLFAIGQIAIVEHLANPTWLVHAAARGHVLGVTRVYAEMNDLLFVGVPIGIAAVVLVRGRSAQSVAIPITLLLSTSFLLQLTRARWIALIASLVVISAWMALQAERRIAVTLRRRMMLMIVAIALAVGITLVLAPGVISAGPLVRRLLSIFTDVGSQTSTLAVRQQVANQMTALLGGHWLTGLGLIPPSSHYYLQFFDGSIRDPDLGVLNAAMTIGVVGAALIYLPLVVALLHCMRRARTRTAVRYPWLSYGGQIWILAAIASSVTLVTLFSVSGLAVTATTLAVLSHPSVSGPDAPDAAAATTLAVPSHPRVSGPDAPDADSQRPPPGKQLPHAARPARG